MNGLHSFRLDGQVAIVTGASRGLGAAMALALAEAGADVALTARGDLHEVQERIERLGRRTIAIHADLADRAAPQKIMDETKHGFGHADILVNNAGIIRRASFLDYSDEDWDAVIDVNLRSIFVLSRAFAQMLVERRSDSPVRPTSVQPGDEKGRTGESDLRNRGKIINVASLLSFQGGIRVAAYTAAKSGLQGLTRAMANELAPLGINVNAIAPGYMVTDNTQALRDDPVRSREILARIPAARWGTPDDLKGAVVFLASPAAAYIHGTTLTIDGGWLSR